MPQDLGREISGPFGHNRLVRMVPESRLGAVLSALPGVPRGGGRRKLRRSLAGARRAGKAIAEYRLFMLNARDDRRLRRHRQRGLPGAHRHEGHQDLYAFVIGRLTQRPEVADVRTSVVYEYLRKTVIMPGG